MVELGGTEYPYQADDGTCTVYSATEIAQIYVAAQTLITGQTAYHNALKSYVNAMTDVEEIATVQYGMDLPEPYAAALSEKMAVAQAQMEAIMQKLGGACMSSVELIAESNRHLHSVRLRSLRHKPLCWHSLALRSKRKRRCGNKTG